MNSLTTGRGLILFILFTILTLGIYPLYIIYAFARETNIACKDDGRHTFGLLMYILLSIVTFGIFSIIWTLLLIDRRGQYIERNGAVNNLTPIFYILSMLFGVFTLGILNIIAFSKYFNQQNLVNAVYNSKGVNSSVSITYNNNNVRSKSSSNLETRLTELNKLHSNGIITNDEYHTLRRKALEEL